MHADDADNMDARAGRREWPRGDPADADLATTCATLTAEVRALRTRMREVEVALGSPSPPGHRTPPTLPEMARRLSSLERQAGVVPGLAPLPGLGTSPAGPSRW